MLDIGIIIYSLMKFIFLVILNQTLLTFRIKRNNILENSEFRKFFFSKKRWLNLIGHFFKILTKSNNWKLSLFNRILIICYFQSEKILMGAIIVAKMIAIMSVGWWRGGWLPRVDKILSTCLKQRQCHDVSKCLLELFD